MRIKGPLFRGLTDPAEEPLPLAAAHPDRNAAFFQLAALCNRVMIFIIDRVGYTCIRFLVTNC